MKTIIVLTTAALVSTAAFAQRPPESPSAPANTATTPPATTASPAMLEIFDKLDTNHDGKLSQDEAKAQPTVAMNFAGADGNHDGALAKEEFLSAFKPQ